MTNVHIAAPLTPEQMNEAIKLLNAECSATSMSDATRMERVNAANQRVLAQASGNAKRTNGPWNATELNGFWNIEPNVCALFACPSDAANAAFIVRACNVHESLSATVEEMAAALRGILDALPTQHESFQLRNAVRNADAVMTRFQGTTV